VGAMIRHCMHPAFQAIGHCDLDPLTAEILDSAPPLEPVQLAATMRALRREPALAAPSMSMAAAGRRSACSRAAGRGADIGRIGYRRRLPPLAGIA